jgi:hypothetical protein
MTINRSDDEWGVMRAVVWRQVTDDVRVETVPDSKILNPQIVR